MNNLSDRLDTIDEILSEIKLERVRQISVKKWDDLDKKNTRDNWVSYITTYAGKAGTAAVNGNEDFRENMIKVAALALAAIESKDRNYV